MVRRAGLSISLAKLSELVGSGRLDPEYYQPYYQALNAKLKSIGAVTVESFADANDGFHESPVWIEDGGIPCISAKCVKDNYFVMVDAGQVSLAQRDKNPTKEARIGDVLITSVGTIGNSAVIHKEILPAIMDRHVGIVRIHKNANVDPYYLAAFLNSKYGRFQTWRESTGNVQLSLFIEKINKLLVPIGEKFNETGKLVRKSYDKFRQSEQLYADAENLLASELGLNKLDLSESLFNVRRLSEVEQAARTDAEYYQQKYYRLEGAIVNNKFPHKALGKLIEPVKNGFDYREFTNDGTSYIRVGDVRNGRVDTENCAKVPFEFDEIDKDVKLKTGDVLFTRKGTFGQVAVVRHGQEKSIISSEIMLLRMKKEFSKDVLPDYLALYLNSDFGYQQVVRRVHGVAYYSISQPDLAQILILIPKIPVQEKIAEKVEASLSAEKEAKRLLAEAKSAVEGMIEG